MSASRLEKLIWVLIFGGLLTLGLGVSLLQGDGDGGWAVAVAGAAAAVLGAVLIFVRARMRDPR